MEGAEAVKDLGVGQLLGDLILKWAGGLLSWSADSCQPSCFIGCEIDTLLAVWDGEAVWLL